MRGMEAHQLSVASPRKGPPRQRAFPHAHTPLVRTSHVIVRWAGHVREQHLKYLAMPTLPTKNSLATDVIRLLICVVTCLTSGSFIRRSPPDAMPGLQRPSLTVDELLTVDEYGIGQTAVFPFVFSSQLERKSPIRFPRVPPWQYTRNIHVAQSAS